MSGRSGSRTWFFPDGDIPPPGDAEPFGHESLLMLNPNDEDARVTITVYFEDREPIKDVSITVGAERTFHIRLDKPEHLNGVQLPQDVPYAIRVCSDVPIIVQHSRLDTTQTNLALMTTIAYPIAK